MSSLHRGRMHRERDMSTLAWQGSASYLSHLVRGIQTCSVVDTDESQPSPLPPLQVPSSDRHTCSTYPPAYHVLMQSISLKLWL